jgi:hypothetical protein
VEVDENKHSTYDCSCENKRLMLISKDLHHRPIAFIRFNPDGYTEEDGTKIRSCWRLNKIGIMTISAKFGQLGASIGRDITDIDCMV